MSFIRDSYHLARKYPFSQWGKIIVDYWSLFRKKGLTTDEYYEYEFEKRDDSYRDAFLGKNEQRYYLDYLNPQKYYSLARNKYLAHKVIEGTGIRTSELLCYFHPEGKVSGSNVIATDLFGLLRILSEKKVGECVIKTTESSHGDNVVVVNAIRYYEQDACLSLFDGTEVLLSNLVRNGNPLLFESIVRQSAQMSELNPSSVNTVRVMTTLYPDGSAKVIAAWMKVGRLGKCVDNAGSGGNVDAGVNVETGEIMRPCRFDGWRKVTPITCHPDSGQKLDGFHIPGWAELKSQLEMFQQAYPWCKAVGWDVAITDEGPTVIEVNDFWDTTGQYFLPSGWRNEIRDCFLAWQKTGRKYAMCRQPNALGLEHLEKIVSYE